MHKVTRHVLVPDGATFKTKDTDFLISDNPDFHPTDVIEDADGSLVVIDTGGWYKICCPTSQLSKPDVLGAIYRIRRIAGKKVDDPRGYKIKWQQLRPRELVKLLDDDRPAVIKRSIHQLASRKADAIPALSEVLKNSRSETTRRNAVWALTQIDEPKAREASYAAFPTGKNSVLRPDDSVAQAAIYSIGLWRDTNAISGPRPHSFPPTVALSAALENANLSMQRASAEAFGRIAVNKPFAVEHLLKMPEAHAMDRVLEHSLIFALIELDDPQSTARGLTNRLSQHAALIALDQMDDGGLQAGIVLPFLTSSDPGMRKAAAWVAGHHPDWGPALAGFFRNRLTATNLPDADRDELKGQLAQFAHSEAIQDIIGSMLNDTGTPVATRQVLLASMAAASLKDPPDQWGRAVASCLAQTDEALLHSAVQTARALSQAKTNAPHFSEALMRIAREQAHLDDLRLEALAALPSGLRTADADTFSFLCANVDPAKPAMTRSLAASVLARAKLRDQQLLALADTLKTVSPLEMMKLLAAFEHSTNEAVGLKLVAALKESKGLASLRPDAFKLVLAKYPASVQQPGKELLASLNVDSAKQGAHIDELLAALKDGDIRRGQNIFNSQKAACFTCHALGYQGGHVGPDLTSIGTVRTERDLLESIVYPSASFVRSFEPFVVTTKSEESFTGILRKDAADEIVLVTGPNVEVRVARSDIVEMRPGTVSVMPAGLDQQLTKQELSDLVAFLKSTKWGPR
jgi:putative heme-binding domain-containing protein